MSTNEKCPICQDALTNYSTDFSGDKHFDCPSCGRFGLSASLVILGEALQVGENVPLKLKHLLYEHRLKKGIPLFIAAHSGGTSPQGMSKIRIQELLAQYPQSPLEYFDRALENLARLVDHPTADTAFPSDSQLFSLVFSEGRKALAMLKRLSSLGYISHDSSFSFQFAPEGWARLKEIQRPGRDSRQAFVAMSFDPARVPIYENGIKPAIEEADDRTKAVIMNQKEHNNRVDDVMIAEIRRSRYMVADYTGQRHNVYYEAGFAHGLGLPVIWCMDEAEKEPPHFDTRQYSYIRYANAEDLKVKLTNRIQATNV